MHKFFELITDPFIVSWFGAICGHILSLYSNEFEGSQPFLRKLMPDRSDAFYCRVDFVLLPLIGAALSVALINPSSIQSAMVSGLTWSGTLMAMLKR